MRLRRSPKPKLAPGEYPESFVRGWLARTLPMATPAEAASAVRHLRSQGWTGDELAEFILPYLPRGVGESPAVAARAEPALPITVPRDVTSAWLDQHLPALDRRQLRLVVDELEGRGWPSGRVAMVVLPHLLPRLPTADARAVIAGLADLGMTDEEIARATRRA